ncbi:MAG TPA: hypothetical protein PLG78_18015, partial [Leptospiraceae bacterium]|nr:hypothetical protein [Leptospiraceae bacterium]
KGVKVIVKDTFNEKEIEIAMRVKSAIIGINHRDLDTLKMDLSLTPRLAPVVRRELPGCVIVAESGVESRDGLKTVDEFVDSVLIGTAFMKSQNVASIWQEIFGGAR